MNCVLKTQKNQEEKDKLNETIASLSKEHDDNNGLEDDVMCKCCMKSVDETRLLVNDSVEEPPSQNICTSKKFFKGVLSGSIVTLVLLTVIFVLIYIFFPSCKGSGSSA